MSRKNDHEREARHPRALSMWVERLRERVNPTYVDWDDIPEDAPSPYHARLRLAAPVAEPGMDVAEMDVTEREVVKGTARTVFEVRCACRRRWFQRKLERVQVCPRCGKAVLVESPTD